MKKYLAFLAVFLLMGSMLLNSFFGTNFDNNVTTSLNERSLNNKNGSEILLQTQVNPLVNNSEVPLLSLKGTFNDWINFRDSIIDQIKAAIPNPQEGTHYYIVDNHNWTIHFWTEGKFILPFEPINVLYYIVEDISSLRINLYVDDDNASRGRLTNLTKNLIENLTGRNVFPAQDYNLPDIPFDAFTAKPSRAGQFVLQATQSSTQIIGQFPITLKKRLDTSKYPTKGINEDWIEIRDQIVNEINSWYPNSKINVDYQILDLGNGDWQIKSLPNAFVEVNYNFRMEKPNIQDLNLLFQYDVDDNWVTKGFIESQVSTGIQNLSPHASIKTDFVIDFIPYNYLTRPTNAGKYEVSSTPNSTRIQGNFDLILWKYIKNENYDQIGTTEHGQEVLNNILTEFKKWNPYAREGTDYVINQTSNTWSITSTITSYVVVDFTYQIRNLYDLTKLDRVLKFNYSLNPRLTVNDVYNGIRSLIANVSPLAAEQTDYILPPRNSFWTRPDGTINGIGWYEVKANPTSTYLTGQFTVLIQANLKQDLNIFWPPIIGEEENYDTRTL